MMSAVARARAALLRYRAELDQLHAERAQAHAAHVAEIDQILRELEADIAGMPKIPIRNLILTAVQRAPRRGRTRAQIIEFIEQHFGIIVNKSTATVTLNRLRNQDLIEFSNGLWFPL
jgi:hypothetical protein